MREHKTVNQTIILEFQSYLLIRLDNISQVDTHDKALQQKLLYMAYLDGLAGSRYPGDNNKPAFIRLISQYSTWKYAQHICPLSLKKISDKYLEKTSLKNYANDILDGMISSGGAFGAAQVPLASLPTKKELEEYWPQSWLGNRNSPKIENLTQVIQLYKCRNTLVHSFQHRKESPFPRKNSDVIHYRQYMKTQDSFTSLYHSKFELVHPVQFLHSLCKEITLNLMNYFIEEKINPLVNYYDDFGEY